MTADAKTPRKMVACRIQKHIKKIIYYDHVGFVLRIQGLIGNLLMPFFILTDLRRKIKRFLIKFNNHFLLSKF